MKTRFKISAILCVFFVVMAVFSGCTWAKTYGGTGNDYARSIQQTSDGGYIVAGEACSRGAGLL